MSYYTDTENYIDLGNYIETSEVTYNQPEQQVMATHARSLLLSAGWDLMATASGNIATTTGNYAMAQDVATACRLFFGELWYNVENGVPYFQEILGKRPARSVFKAHLRMAALTVPGVVDAKVYIDSIERRRLIGRVQFTDETGKTNNVVL